MEALKLHDAVVFLVVAGVVIPLVQRLRVSPVLGFLLVGLAVGPFGFGRFAPEAPVLNQLLITDPAGVSALAELGVIFLMFMIGLELSLERLWGIRRLVFGMGFLQVLISTVVIATIAWAFGNNVQSSVLLGSCLALSSTAVVMQLLIEQRRFGSPVGRGSFAVLLAQDLAVVPLLFLVATFGASGDATIGWELARALGQATVAIVLILGVGRLVVRPLLRFVGTDGPELFVAVTLLLIVATATVTHAAGLSAALGAFLAGLLLAESEYRYEVEVNLAPFKGLLMGLFFMSVGMSIDLAAILADPVWIPLAVVGLIVVKALVAGGLSRAFGFTSGQSVEIGLLLGQGGEFAFVVVALALGFGLLPKETAQFMLIVAGATMVLTPGIAHLARRAGTALAGPDGSAEELSQGERAGHVILVGFGRTGRMLAGILNRQKIEHVGLDLDAHRVSELSRAGEPVFLGDASREAMLHKVDLASAAALVVCTDDAGATQRVLHTARRIALEVPIVVRARDAEHAAELIDAGATRVVPELTEAGLQMCHVLLEQIGLPGAIARDVIEAERLAAELPMAIRRIDG